MRVTSKIIAMMLAIIEIVRIVAVFVIRLMIIPAMTLMMIGQMSTLIAVL